MLTLVLRATVLAVGLLSVTSLVNAQQCRHPDFHVELLYGVPDIEHPSVVTCDDRGNLFVGEDPMDMRGPTTKEFDRILFIEFNPDGSVRRKTVFAEGLSAVFGLVWLDDALYVMHAPHYTMFKDTDGDGVADLRKDLADGFGPAAGIFGFNDHIVTGTRLGLDGYVYVSVGDKGIQKATGSDGSSITLEGGGVVRMKPDGTKLEIFSCGTRNHLDVAMDSLDNLFTYDNTDDGLGWWTRFTHHIPTGYYGYPYDYHPHADRHLPQISEHGGGSPVGAACYREAVWPEKYRDAAFHCEWGKGKVQVFYPRAVGATFTAEMEDFLVPEPGSDFRPQDLCFSPDGRHMYVADWNFGGWTQDKPAGRLYRVTYVGQSEPVASAAGNPAQITDWVQDLGSTSYHHRVAAQWRLASLGQAAVEPLTDLLSDRQATSDAKVHAIWSLNALADNTASFDPTAVWLDALEDEAAVVRSQAARAIGTRHAAHRWSVYSVTESERAAIRHRPTMSPLVLPSLLQRVAIDEDPTVRLQAAVAIGRIGHPKGTAVLLTGLGDSDLTTRFAKVQAVRAINHWEPALAAVCSDDPGIAAGTLLALTGVYDSTAVKALGVAMLEAPTSELQVAAVQALSEVFRRGDRYETGWWGTRPAAGKPSRAKVHDWEGTERVLTLLRQALNHPNPEVRRQAVQAQSIVEDPEALERVRDLAANEPDNAVRQAVFSILAARRDDAAVAVLATIASSRTQPVDLRQQALSALTQIGGDQAQQTLMSLAADQEAPAVVLVESLSGIQSLGLSAARGSVQTLLNHPDERVRAAATACLGQIAGTEATEHVLALLTDPQVSVRVSALRTLGALKDPAAVPPMSELLTDPEVRPEAMLALANIADTRALGAYLQGLMDRNPQVRQASAAAVASLKNEITDELLALHQANELAPDVRRELGALFSTPQPIRHWQVLGNWSKDLPRPEFALDQAPDFQQQVTVGDRQLNWQTLKISDPDGKYEPNRLGEPTANSWMLAYATIESDREVTVTWQLGSDDQAILWFNNDQLYEHLGDRGWSKDQGRGEGVLRQGTNHIWFLTGNSSGPWQFSLAVGGPDPALEFLYVDVPPALDLASFRKAAQDNPGDPLRGKELFFDAQGIGCAKCHAIGKEGTAEIGPNLLGVGAKYPRDELIRSVLEPSNRIASGYEMTIITTFEGETLQGIVKQDTDDEVVFATTQAETVRIPKDLIDERQKSALSAMPNGLEKGMTLNDFADIIAYLQNIK